ncbi:MAG: class I SAM-dependent methyltransferase [Janthinobacterium lividum]
MNKVNISITKFDAQRAGAFSEQARIALAGYDACHELGACMLSAALEGRSDARILVVGAGGSGGEIIAASKLESTWSFVGVDPAEAMLDVAKENVRNAGITNPVEWKLGTLDNVPYGEQFDAATLMGVFHHLPGDEQKSSMLAQIRDRLQPDAPLVLAGNHFPYASQPLMLKAWANRWKMHGANASEVASKLAKILEAADPPQSEAAVVEFLAAAGFDAPLRFFSSLFWGAWIAKRNR